MSLEMMARVTLVLSIVLMGSWVMRNASAAARHLLGVCGLLAALVLPLLAAALPSWELPILPPAAKAAVGEPAKGMGAGSHAPSLRTSAEQKPLLAAQASVLAFGEQRDPARRPLPVEGPARSDWVVWGLVAWGLGSAAVLGRFAVGWRRMTRIARAASPLDCSRTWRMVDLCCAKLGLRQRPRVLTSPEMRVPAVWGVRRPTVLLPQAATSWPAGRLRVVLLHELAHLRRRDGLALVLGRLCTAAWWFHPLVWIVDRSARRECERACDDVVLSCGERPSSYAAHLLEILSELPPRASEAAEVLAIVKRGQLERRLRSILDPGLRRGLSRRVAIAALALVLLGVLSVTALRPVSRAEGRSEPTIPREDPPVLYLAQATERPLPAKVRADREEREDREGEVLFDRAFELHSQERFEEASRGFEEAAAAGYRPAIAIYNAACGQARLGQAEQAVRSLKRALDEEGFDELELLYEDADLDPIRRDPAFRELMEQVGEDRRVRWSTHRYDRYDAAVERYEDLAQDTSAEAEDWAQTGVELLRLRDYERAVDALERAGGAAGSDQATAIYNLACAYALQGEKQAALDGLERAVLAGFENDERFRNDADLDSLREDPRFERIEELHYRLSLARFERGSSEGLAHYSERRWAPAVKELSDFVAEHPQVGRAYHNLGWALHFSRKHAQAAEAFERQLELGYRPSTATYNIACCHAMEGDVEQAFEWLERAVETGDISAGQMLEDDDLEALRADPRFDRIVERAVELNGDGHPWVDQLHKLMKGWHRHEEVRELPM